MMGKRNPILAQLTAKAQDPSLWLPATQGVWRWWPLRSVARQMPTGRLDRTWWLDDPQLLLVRGRCIRRKHWVAATVVFKPYGRLTIAGVPRRTRDLPLGVWAFVRPLRRGDPTWGETGR